LSSGKFFLPIVRQLSITICQMDALDFPSWLQDRLDEKGWRSTELAKRADLSDAALSRILRGTRKPDPETLKALSHALKISEEDIFRAAGLLSANPDQGEGDEWDRRIMHLLKLFPAEEKEKIVKRLELEAQFHEQQRPAKSTHKTRA
jgi:transcriptional regulator with XRE-family HTH domain